VVDGDGDSKLHPPDFDHRQVLGCGGQEEYGEVEVAKAHTLDQLVGVGLLDVKHHPRVQGPHAAQERRQKHWSGSRKNADTDCTFGKAAVSLHILARTRYRIEDYPRVIGESNACAGRHSAAGTTLQEYQANFAFKAFDGH
jgi:hypothetical protein